MTSNEKPDKTNDNKILSKKEINEYSWSIRPCFMYHEEYKECASIRGRFHQYFIFGESLDCTQWKQDYNNCVRYENHPEDLKAATEIIDSETKRRTIRLKAHTDNDVWEHRKKKPPEDWTKPLPDWLIERDKNSFITLPTKNEDGTENRTLCVIM